LSLALRTDNLGKRYGSFWALQDCSFELNAGQVMALVGPNGSGKSTLLELASGLTKADAGSIEVLGVSPAEALPRTGFVAQDHPLYRAFSVREMLRFGKELNPRWDDGFARSRVKSLGLPLDKKVGQLSGGQQAQIALVLALAKRPELLLLDEPVAAFDPLARHDFLQLLMETVAETGATVLLSSHILGDLERVCDSLLLLSGGRAQLCGETEDILASHRVVIGPLEEEVLASCVHHVVQRSRSSKQVSTLIRLDTPLVLGEAWTVHEPSLEDIVIGYLQRGDVRAPRAQEEVAV
jgi:ABC-type multidrug transport system ATPase subunit